MYSIISFQSGVITEAVILAAGKDQMRIAVPGFADVVELHQFGGRWYTDTGDAVEFESLLEVKPEPVGMAAPARTFAAGAAV